MLAALVAAASVAPAFAQPRVVAPVEGVSAPVTPVAPVAGAAAGMNAAGAAPALSLTTLHSAPSASAAPSFTAPSAAAPVPALAAPAAVAAPIAAPTPAAPAAAKSLSRSAALLVAPSTRLQPSASVRRAAAPSGAVRAETSREAAAVSVIEGGVRSWGPSRSAQALGESAVPGAASNGPAPLERASSASSAEKPSEPSAPAPATRARPRAARAALIAGASLVAAAAAAFTFPALLPAALAVAKGPALYAGFTLLKLSRLWRTPGAGVESPRGPPAPTGWFKSAKSVWNEARYGADAQKALEARVGGSSLSAFQDWFLGGLRAAALWFPIAIGGMFAGWGLAKPFARFAGADDAVGMISFDALEKLSLGGHLLGFVAASLAAEAAVLGAFDLIRAAAEKLGAGKASPWIAGAVAMGLSAFLVTLVTTTPSVVGTMLGIEAALLWLRARSGSWLAPLALRGLFSMLSLEFARISIGMVLPAAGTLVGLPAVWTGVAVTGVLFSALAWSARSLRPAALWGAFKAQLQRVRDFGAGWGVRRADGAPHSPWPLMKLAALWGMVLYALGDLTFSGVHALSGGAEPTPAILGQMLSLPVDLVLANFLLVGFLEEFVFRKNIFKPMLNRFNKWRVDHKKTFWAAAVLSGLIFSYAHYIDFGAVLAHFGVGSAPVASGMYAFSWGGFVSRAVLGVVLAWLYAASGTLLLPIFAHFLADSYEGLGLHFGFLPFLGMAAAAMLIQRAWLKRRAARSN